VLLSVTCYAKFEQLREEHWQSSFRVSHLHQLNGATFTTTMESNGIFTCEHFMKSWPESGNESHFRPCRLESERGRESVEGTDPGCQGIIVVAVPQHQQDGTDNQNGTNMNRLIFSSDHHSDKTGLLDAGTHSN
jgi:hypothetical protein